MRQKFSFWNRKACLSLIFAGFLFIGSGNVWADTYSFTFATSGTATYTADGTKALAGVNWTLATVWNASTYYGSGTNGLQLGSAANPALSWALSTSEIAGTITSVKVYARGANAIPKLQITVGSTSNVAQNLSTTSSLYEWTGAASGTIAIDMLGGTASSAATYIASIEVTYTPASYNVTLNPCGGSVAGSTTLSGSTVTLPSATPPTCVGWTFAGWKAGSAISIPSTYEILIPAGSYAPTGDITLYAVYKTGSDGTLTITRDNFQAGTLGYETTDNDNGDLWTATTTEGNVITGYFDLYSNTTQTTMQTNTSRGTFPYNNVAIPGAITKITLTGGATGTARAWEPYLSTTPLTKANYTTGDSQGSLTAANNAASTNWAIDASEGYTYFYLNMTGGAAYLNSIVIEYGNATYNSYPTCGPITWEGTIDNDWEEAGNWDSGSVPTATDDVIIPAGASVTLTAVTEVNNLTLEPGASIDLATSGLLVYGTLTAQKAIDAKKWFAIGFPFDVETVYSSNYDEELAGESATGNFWLRSYDNTSGDKIDFTTETQINANQGYIFQLSKYWSFPDAISFVSKTDDVVLSKVAALTFVNNTYTLQANPNLDPFAINVAALEAANKYVYRLSSDGTAFIRLTDDATIAPFESVITILTTGPLKSSLGIDVVTDVPTFNDEKAVVTRYYNLQGIEVAQPVKGQIYLVKNINESGSTKVVKQILK